MFLGDPKDTEFGKRIQESENRHPCIWLTIPCGLVAIELYEDANGIFLLLAFITLIVLLLRSLINYLSKDSTSESDKNRDLD